MRFIFFIITDPFVCFFLVHRIKRFMQKKHLRGNASMEDGFKSVGGRSSVFSGDASGSPDGRIKASNFADAYRQSKFANNPTDATRNSIMRSNEYGLEQSGVFKMKAKK